MNRLTKTSKLFSITGLVIIIFSFYNRFFLLNKNFRDNFKELNKDFYSSDLFLWIGLLFLLLAVLYLLTDKRFKFYLSEKLALIHYVTTTLFVVGLMCVPILDTITNGGSVNDKFPILFNVVIISTFIGMILVFASIIVFLINILTFIGKTFSGIFIKN